MESTLERADSALGRHVAAEELAKTNLIAGVSSGSGGQSSSESLSSSSDATNENDDSKMNTQAESARVARKREKRERKEKRRAEREKRQKEASIDVEEEAWELKEKRRRKSKHDKHRRDGAEAGNKDNKMDAAGSPVDVLKHDGDDMDSARASPPLHDDVKNVKEEEAPVKKEMVGAKLVAGAAAAQGARPYMEDRHAMVHDFKPKGMDGCDGVRRSFMGVYDGHNGEWAAEFASEKMHTFLKDDVLTRCSTPPCQEEEAKYNSEMEQALKAMYMMCDEEILDTTQSRGRRDGSTSLCVVQVGRALFTAHAGDSRAVVGYADGRCRAMTEDHKPSVASERRRITEIGGRIEFCGCWRVVADHPTKPLRAALAVSRSLGDIDFKRPVNAGVTAEPDIRRFELDENIQFVVLASDGMWDVIRDQEAGDIARSVLKANDVLRSGVGTYDYPEEDIVRDACREAAQALVDKSMERGTNDNVTVVVGLYMHTQA
jgi:serine/threonine protein phosphatase PrpC